MNSKRPKRPSIRPGLGGAVARAIALVAISVVAAAGFAAEPLPAQPAAERAAPSGSTPLPQGADPPAAVRPASPRRTLRDVVSAIESDHGIRISLDWAVSGAAPSDVDPTGLPAEIALREVFKDYDLFLHYTPNPETGALEVKHAWAFTRGQGDTLQVVAESAAAGLGLESGDPAQRALAHQGLSAPPGTDPRDALLSALADPNESMRQYALLTAQANGLPLPTEVIEGLMLNDASETVRMSAMDALTMIPEIDPGTAWALLERGTQDPSPVIRDHAAALLSALNAQVAGAAPGSGAGAVPELDTVMRGLADADENARQQALVTVQSYGLPVAPENLERILMNDASEAVRVIALDALAVNVEIDPDRIRTVLEWATRDPSPLVQERAAVLLGASNPLTDMPEEAGTGDPLPQAPDEVTVGNPAEDGSGEDGNPAQ